MNGIQSQNNTRASFPRKGIERSWFSPARIAVAASVILSQIAWPAQAAPNAPLQVLPGPTPIPVFAGDNRSIEVLLRNSGEQPVPANLRARILQAARGTAVLLREVPWKSLQILPGQTVKETATLDFPAVRAETRFIIRWLDGTNVIPGATEVRVWPTNLLAELQILAGDAPLGVFDPRDELKPILQALHVPVQDLAQDGFEKLESKLAIVGPFHGTAPLPEELPEKIRGLARRGKAVLWIDPSRMSSGTLKPSYYTVAVGEGFVLVAQPELFAGLNHDPLAQWNLLQLARRALRHETVNLPGPNSAP